MSGWTATFVDRHTSGFDALAGQLSRQSWEDLESLAGVSRNEMLEFARMVGAARTAVFVWAMGITQHECGEDNVRAIVNLGLSRGFVGREKCGLMPIRGHSGVQGGAEMGAYSTVLPGGLALNEENARRFSERWGFEVPAAKGLTAPEMIDAAHEGRLDVLVSSGGNFLRVLPDPDYCREALERIPLRVHIDIVLSEQMLVDAAETVILLPAETRYEMTGGVTETTTERRVIFSPEIEGPRIAEARPEWAIFTEIAARVRPDIAERVRFRGTPEIRHEIAEMIPLYAGIERLEKFGDQFQYGGSRLCDGWRFPTPDGRARFSEVELPKVRVPDGRFVVTTRRGKQFNTMIHEAKDSLTGAVRDTVLLSRSDAERLDIREGDALLLRSDRGELRGRATIAPVMPGTLQVHWPEGQVLLDRTRRSRQAGIPDYNASVTLEKVQ